MPGSPSRGALHHVHALVRTLLVSGSLWELTQINIISTKKGAKGTKQNPQLLSMLDGVEPVRMLTAMTTPWKRRTWFVIITGPANHHRSSGKCQTEATFVATE